MKLSSSQRCEIVKYAVDQHGAAETARHFSRKLEKCVSESTMKSMHVEEIQNRARTDKSEEEIAFFSEQKAS